MNIANLISARAHAVEISGIRKVFELGKSLKDPVNLSIGQPHFPVPQKIKDAAKAAIDGDKNGYTLTQGIPELRERLLADVRKQYPNADRDLLITSGTSGALMLAILATVNPGEEVVAADPYFVMYPNMVALAGGKFVGVDTYPDFKIDPAKMIAACTAKTKMILLCSPANPTGAIIEPEAMKAIVEFATPRGILVVSDEIYKAFHYDTDLLAGRASDGGQTDPSLARPANKPRSPAEFDDNVLVVEGFGKTYGMTGWRLGHAHGPKALIEQMMKLQQSTFVCAPSMVQFAGLAAIEFDVTGIVADYKRKRDMMVEGLKGHYEFTVPGGAFYIYPKAPWGTATEFVTAAVKKNLLMIPGSTFSVKDSHFRISYAATDETLKKGIEILRDLAKG